MNKGVIFAVLFVLIGFLAADLRSEDLRIGEYPPNGIGIEDIGYTLPWSFLGRSGVPEIRYEGPGLNADATSGPVVVASINGTGGWNPVFLGNGASHIEQTDFYLPLNGIDWYHKRIYSSISSSSLTWQGEGWWCDEMMNVSVAGTDGLSDVDVEISPFVTIHFDCDNSVYTCEYNRFYTLSFASDKYTLTRADGFRYIFHDSQVGNYPGRLYQILDPYGNDWEFTYSGTELSYIVVDVVQGNDHKITYSYTSGLLDEIKVYKFTTVGDANLIGEVEYYYHNGDDTDLDPFRNDSGEDGDLMKVIVKRKATMDGDGDTSIEETYYYRYYEGSWQTVSNPGTDHQLRYVLHPENADLLNSDVGTPESQTNANFEDYANISYAYIDGDRVRDTSERHDRASGGGSEAGGDTLDTTYQWTINGSCSDLDDWYMHGKAIRDDNSRVCFDLNELYKILTWAVYDDDTTPTLKSIWHFDYGTSGDDEENRLLGIHYPSNCSHYDSNTYAVTLRSTEGVVYDLDYDFASATYNGHIKTIEIKEGTSGSPDELISYDRDDATRPDLVSLVTVYESGGGTGAISTDIDYSFYDAGTNKFEIKEVDITHPCVTTSRNGPGNSYRAHEKYFFDTRSGSVRWYQDGEGCVEFYAYYESTGGLGSGVCNFGAKDVATSTLSQAIDARWSGPDAGELTNDDDVPYTTTSSSPLEITWEKDRDWLGRTRSYTDEGGMVTYFVYMDDEIRKYPAWDDSADDNLLPIRITKKDKEGRVEELIELNTDKNPHLTSQLPDGEETYVNSDISSYKARTYDINGLIATSSRYHGIPASFPDDQFDYFYMRQYAYDGMGRLEYAVEDVLKGEVSGSWEQVTRSEYDYLGRLIKQSEGVSDDSHNVSITSASYPTLVTTDEFYFDDPDLNSVPQQGEGDGNLIWRIRHYDPYNEVSTNQVYQYDWRNRLCVTFQSSAPHFLVLNDNLDRVIRKGTFSAVDNLSPGEDPADAADVTEANRLRLTKTHYNELGQIYRFETYEDPKDQTPEDVLATEYYYDGRGLLWSKDAANTGIKFFRYDGAGRATEVFYGTDYDDDKYAQSGTRYVPDYPDDDEGIVELIELTLNDNGDMTKKIVKELNHDDTNGMDIDGTDFIRTYKYYWYDDAHRLTDVADFGTNNSSGWKDNSTAPSAATPASRSDTVLVTSYSHNEEGRLEKTTDPKGIETLFTYDKLGRVVAVTEDYGAGKLNRKTEFSYTGKGRKKQDIHDPDGDNTFSAGEWTLVGSDADQETVYYYENTQNSSWVSAIEYPEIEEQENDPKDFTYDYYKDGTLKEKTDNNGSKIKYTYDSLRRKTYEELFTVGSYTGGAGQVDASTRLIKYDYSSLGELECVTSYSDVSGTNVINQVEYTFNDANLVTAEELEIDGAVVGGTTPKVQYSYEYSSSDNYHRLNNVTYPDGRVIWIGYKHTLLFQNEVNDVFNRPGQIARDDDAYDAILAEYDVNSPWKNSLFQT